jgi:putative membrane protein
MKIWIQKIILQIVLNTAAILALQYFKILTFRGDLVTLLKLSAIIGLINIFLKPILSLVSKPLIWITFGLFAIILNLILLKAAMLFAPELIIAGFNHLLISSLTLGLANTLATINKQN